MIKTYSVELNAKQKIREARFNLNIIICTDKVGGMMFNKRRVSRDSAVSEDVLKTTRGETLYVKPYSEKLFLPFGEKYAMPRVVENPLDIAKEGEWCFIEDQDVSPYLDKVEKLLIYNWNRFYPYELKFDLSILSSSFRISERDKFEGTSHEEITRELYRKDFRSKAK